MSETVTADAGTLLQVSDLVVEYPGSRRLGRRTPAHRAVDGVSFSVAVGETLGVVGESGSGKSTIAGAVLGFVPVTSGKISTAGHDVTAFGSKVPRGYRREVQVVFQDPLSSLNPSMTIEELVGEPVKLHDSLSGAELRARVVELLRSVGLDEHHLSRLPHEISGGQRQRVAIARALSVRPQLLILDEPVSALDVSTRAQVVNLLEDLADATGTAYLLIGHDLAVVRHSSDRIVVLYQGRIVEQGPADRVCDAPVHPYTQLLIAAVPEPDPPVQAKRRALRRELAPTADGRTSEGCPFAPRCPAAFDLCWAVDPPAYTLPADGGTARCHLADPARTQSDQ